MTEQIQIFVTELSICFCWWVLCLYSRPVFYYRGDTLFKVRFGHYKAHFYSWGSPGFAQELVSKTSMYVERWTDKCVSYVCQCGKFLIPLNTCKHILFNASPNQRREWFQVFPASSNIMHCSLDIMSCFSRLLSREIPQLAHQSDVWCVFWEFETWPML